VPHKDPAAKKAYMKEYAAKNRVKAYAAVKQWRKENPEKVKEQHRRYARKHPEMIVAKTIRWKRRNPEKAAEVSRRTRTKNSVRILVNKARYRANKAKRTPLWLTKADLFEIQCIYTYRDALKKVGLDYEVDHIIPLKGEEVSGLHVPENLLVIKASENRLKNNRYAE
jgi:CRISPR/Cas system CMR-associated protein Cmr5 small subunit